MPYPADAAPIQWSIPYIKFLITAGHTTRRIGYSTFTLLIWDMFITFDREVKYIWPARWTVIKVLFLFNRYIAPIMLFLGIWTMSGYATGLSDGFCRTWLLAGAAMEMACLTLITFVMVFRLHAALGLQRKGFLTMLALWLAGIVASAGIYIQFLWIPRRFIYWENVLGNFCFAVVPNLWPLLMSTVIQHVILLVLLLVKVVVTPRSAKTALLRILLTDGIIFYAVTLAATLFSVLVWRFADHGFNGLPPYATWAVCIMAASRFLLSLKTPIQSSSTLSSMASRSTEITSTHDTIPVELEETGKQWIGDRMLMLPGVRRQDSQNTHFYADYSSAGSTAGVSGELGGIRTKVVQKRGRVVQVEVDDVEWRESSDYHEPRVMETRLGRYDSWL